MSAVSNDDQEKPVGVCRRRSISCPTIADGKDCLDPAKNSVACVTGFAVAHGNHSECLQPSATSCSGTVAVERHVLTTSASISAYMTTTSMQPVSSSSSLDKNGLQIVGEQACLSDTVCR